MSDAQSSAIRRHHLLGESVVIWRDGHVVELPPHVTPDRALPPEATGAEPGHR